MHLPCVLPSLARFDYEGLEPKTTYYIMRDLEALVTDKSFIGQQFAVGSHVYSVAKTDSFEYVDPVDGTVTKKQVLVRKLPEQVIKQIGTGVGGGWWGCDRGVKCPTTGGAFRDDLLRALHFTDDSPIARKGESLWQRLPTYFTAEGGLKHRTLAPYPLGNSWANTLNRFRSIISF